MSADLRTARLALGGKAVLSMSEAARLLPVRSSDGARWLRSRGLVRDVPGLGELVVWGDVVAAIQADEVTPPKATKRRGTLPRESLG